MSDPPALHRSTRPRVTHFIHSLNTSGMENVVAHIVNGLDADYDHTILCLRDRTERSVRIRDDVPITVIPKPDGHSLGYYWRLTARLRQLAPDLLCTYNWNGVDGIFAGRIAGIRCIAQCEHGWCSNDPDGLAKRRRRVRRFASRVLAGVICVSDEHSAWLRDTVRVRCPVYCIRNGIDTTAYSNGRRSHDLRAELGITDEALLLAVIARLDPIKNHGLLLDAFARLQRSHPAAHLLVVGTGDAHDELARAASEHVHFLGHRSDVPALLRAVDVVALPSSNEGISLVLLEAMATERPVVACAVGGNPTVVEDRVTGILVPAGDPEAMAEALRGYADSPELRKAHGSAGRKRVVEHFSCERMLADYDNVYRSLLSRS